MELSKKVSQLVANIDRRKLTNNTQRVLLSMLTAKNEWVPRTSIRVPSVSARLRDLRKAEFGGFQLECRSSEKDNHRTFYRLSPRSVTFDRVRKVFEGVVVTSK